MFKIYLYIVFIFFILSTYLLKIINKLNNTVLNNIKVNPMGKIDKIYVRDIKKQLGRYPNWPINRNISLGKIGYYCGRKATFSWETDLINLGIQLNDPPEQILIPEIYTSGGAVSYSFEINALNGFPKAKFEFFKKRSVAAQGYKIGHQCIDISKLNSQLLQLILNGHKWDYDWVIITEIWNADGFTTLISKSSESYAEITADPINSNTFNIADFNLRPKVSFSRKIGYQCVGAIKVKPYFQIHRLTKNNKLVPYGQGFSFWGN